MEKRGGGRPERLARTRRGSQERTGGKEEKGIREEVPPYRKGPVEPETRRGRRWRQKGGWRQKFRGKNRCDSTKTTNTPGPAGSCWRTATRPPKKGVAVGGGRKKTTGAPRTGSGGPPPPPRALGGVVGGGNPDKEKTRAGGGEGRAAEPASGRVEGACSYLAAI